MLLDSFRFVLFHRTYEQIHHCYSFRRLQQQECMEPFVFELHESSSQSFRFGDRH